MGRNISDFGFGKTQRRQTDSPETSSGQDGSGQVG